MSSFIHWSTGEACSLTALSAGWGWSSASYRTEEFAVVVLGRLRSRVPAADSSDASAAMEERMFSSLHAVEFHEASGGNSERAPIMRMSSIAGQPAAPAGVSHVARSAETDGRHQHRPAKHAIRSTTATARLSTEPRCEHEDVKGTNRKRSNVELSETTGVVKTNASLAMPS